METRYRRVLSATVLSFLVLPTISSLKADPLGKKRTRTPTPTAAARTTPAAPTAAPTAIPATPTRAPAAPAPAGPAKADVEAGKAMYVKFCQKCHGAQGEGIPRMYALVDAKVLHLGSKQAQGKSDAEIKKSMLDGFGKMEAVEDLTPQQADKILAFERTLSDAKH